MQAETEQFIEKTAQRFGLTPDQSRKAIGVLVKTALDQCTDQERRDVVAKVPDAYPLANSAPPPPKPKGLFGALANLGGERMQLITQTVTALKDIGVKDADLKDFAKAGLEWVENQAGDVVAQIRKRVTGEA